MSNRPGKRQRSAGPAAVTVRADGDRHKKTPWINTLARILGYAGIPLLVFIIGAMYPAIILLFCALFFILVVTDRSSYFSGSRLKALFWVIFIFPFVLSGFIAPVRAVAVGSFMLLSSLSIEFSDEIRSVMSATGMDAILAMPGICMAAAGGLTSWLTLLKQSQQIRNLAESKTASAGIGLAEFRGVARKISSGEDKIENSRMGPDDIIYLSETYSTQHGGELVIREHLARFYLEDETGRILVDPRGAEFWKGVGAPIFEPLRKIYLGGRVERILTQVLPQEIRSLRDGDPVYLIGSVEINRSAPADAVDSERLVVRPSTELKKATLLHRFVFPNSMKKKFIPGGEYRHVFFLSDTEEVQAAEITGMAMRSTFLWTLAWLAPSVWLFIQGMKLILISAAYR
jgi:hypothetical protein